MGKILKFFGWLLVSIVVTLIIAGHIMITIVYSVDYLIDTIWPKAPGAYSSLWIVFASFIPGGSLWLLGHFLEKSDAKYDAKQEAKRIQEADNVAGDDIDGSVEDA